MAERRRYRPGWSGINGLLEKSAALLFGEVNLVMPNGEVSATVTYLGVGGIIVIQIPRGFTSSPLDDEHAPV